MKRDYEKRLCTIEEDAMRILGRARDDAAEQRRRLKAERDVLYARLLRVDPLSAEALGCGSDQAVGDGANAEGAPPLRLEPLRPPPRRPRSAKKAG